MFIPLKLTSDHTLLKSLIKIPDIIEIGKKQNWPYLGLCDENMYGAIEFYSACKRYQIKPIIGLEIEVANHCFYLYARNYKGYQYLLKLNTKKQEEQLNFIDIQNENIIIVLPFQSISLYEELKEIGENQKSSKPMLWIAYTTYLEKNESYVVTPNVVFMPNIKLMKKEDISYLKYLSAIDVQKKLEEIDYQADEKVSYDYYDAEEEDILSIQRFAELIDVVIPHDKRYIPAYDEKITNRKDFLYALCKRGLEKRFPNGYDVAYKRRLQYELDVIVKMDFIDYFLIVYDYILFAKKNGILVGPGRGSAAGSLVSYVLGITDIDPIEYHLLFERFLNIERVSMPDIDVDFEYTKRYQVVDYVKARYGYPRVAGIMTYGTLTCKLAFIQVAKVRGVLESLSGKVSKLLNPKLSLKENLENEEIKQHLEEHGELKKCYQISMRLEGLKKYVGTHAAGVVICSEELDSLIPVIKNGDELLTGVTMNYLEDLGLLKMDFLALKNLTIIQNILDLIKENTGNHIVIQEIDLNDADALSLFQRADTVGIFQFESSGMKNFLTKLKPDSLAEIIAALALYRPGPMQYIDEFIARKEGRKKVTYIHPDIEAITSETYGIMIYQEQIMQALVKFGGYTFSEADNVRRAMSKKQKEVIESEEEKFISQAIKLGYSKEIASSIYSDILQFAGYGFNKSHSVSYGMIAYQMAYLKVKYPQYYIINLLNMSIGSEEKTKEYFQELKQYQYNVKKVDINESNLEYQLKNGLVIVPFSIVKNSGIEACRKIVSDRLENGPYLDYFQFIARTYGKSVNKKTIESLIEAGAFDSLHENHNTLKKHIDIGINYASLVADLDESLVMKPMLEHCEDLTVEEKRDEELQSYGFYLTNHPASKYQDKGIMKLEHIKKYFNQFVTCYVIIEQIKEIKTKQNQDMAFITASDETGNADFVVFTSAFSMIHSLKKQELVCIRGKVTKRLDKYQININSVRKEG